MRYSRNAEFLLLPVLVVWAIGGCEPVDTESAKGQDAAPAAAAPLAWLEPAGLDGWAPFVSEAGAFAVFGPGKHTTSELNVPTPAGEQKVPVTYFNVDGNIFYVSSHRRDPGLAGTDRQILEAQAKGIVAKFEKVEAHTEAFTARGVAGLRLRLTRPDSYKIIELYITPTRLYQVVTDLPSPQRRRVASFVFRDSFRPLAEGGR